jgi:uncharacterized protein YecA (UPF0149 family)
MTESFARFEEYALTLNDMLPFEPILSMPHSGNISKAQRYLLKPKQKPLYNVGRNELCPCNSGKKFKKCCYGIKE